MLPLAIGRPATIPEYDIEYSLKREAEERLAGKAATDVSARDSHERMADHYADRAWGARERRCEVEFPC